MNLLSVSGKKEAIKMPFKALSQLMTDLSCVPTAGNLVLSVILLRFSI
jgi:hypothetical protein